MIRTLFILALITTSCGIIGTGGSQTNNSSGNQSFNLNELRSEISKLPFKTIEWENIINPDRYGAIKQVTAGFDSLYVETEENIMIIINRRPQQFGGGITQRIINLERPVKWKPVEIKNLPEEIEALRLRYQEIQFKIDTEIRTGNPNVVELDRLKTRRKEINELLDKNSGNDNFYFVSGNVLSCHQRGAPFNLKWEKDLYFIAGTQPLAHDDFVFIGGIKLSRIFLIDSKNGEIVGDFRPQLTKANRIYFPPALNLPYVYFASEDKYLTSYNINNQTSPEWKLNLKSDPSTAPEFTVRQFTHGGRTEILNMIIIGAKDNSVYAINSISGSEIWKYRCESEPVEPIIFLDNDTILINTIGNHLVNLKLLPSVKDPSGNHIGFNSLGEFIWKAPGIAKFVIETDRYIFAETTDGSLRQIEKSTGNFIQDYKISHVKNYVQNPHDAMLYAILESGVMFALKE